jgi:hypothetical protein
MGEHERQLAAVSEGFCPFHGGRLAVPSRVDWPDLYEGERVVGECRRCGVTWLLGPGSDDVGTIWGVCDEVAF